ncbi:MAG: lysylphosphatidylglycerol synthase transmembrane domain-containing protein [Bryobacteraceae bacterium]|nr:lysylphosphatidylglycerol synthase transmembrane domain-containing protein [Bryobacteraceae bacterium]
MGKKIGVAVAMAISVVCLVIALRDFEPNELLSQLRDVHWGWIASAMLFDILVYVLQGWRWSLLLRPVANVPYMRSIRAIYVGLFANEVLPLRTGEIIRCYLQGRWSNLPFSVTLSSALIERIFDGIWLVICLMVATQLAPVDGAYVYGAEVLAGFVVLGAILLGAAMFFKTRAHAVFARHKWLSRFSVLLEDLNLIGHSRYLYLSAVASLPYLLLQVLPIYALSEGYGLGLSLQQVFVVTIILRLAAVVPAAPGNVGTFQLAAKTALTMFGVDKGIATNFSVVMWAVITLPLLITGFIALAVTGIRLSEIRREAEQQAS